ncbi:MAG: hypothetical protein V7K38_08660 [Nostoc sp.]
MIIEVLKFQDAPNLTENFIQKDAQIWTTALAEYTWLLGKEVWSSPNKAT